jgi:hypothetical protein
VGEEAPKGLTRGSTRLALLPLLLPLLPPPLGCDQGGCQEGNPQKNATRVGGGGGQPAKKSDPARKPQKPQTTGHRPQAQPARMGGESHWLVIAAGALIGLRYAVFRWLPVPCFCSIWAKKLLVPAVRAAGAPSTC